MNLVTNLRWWAAQSEAGRMAALERAADRIEDLEHELARVRDLLGEVDIALVDKVLNENNPGNTVAPVA